MEKTLDAGLIFIKIQICFYSKKILEFVIKGRRFHLNICDIVFVISFHFTMMCRILFGSCICYVFLHISHMANDILVYASPIAPDKAKIPLQHEALKFLIY